MRSLPKSLSADAVHELFHLPGRQPGGFRERHCTGLKRRCLRDRVHGSTDFPIAGSVFQTTYGGGNADAFVTELNPTGSALVYSTYLGGTATDIGNGIAVDAKNPAGAYVAGQTCSFDFPLANPLQPNYGGNCDAFVSKVSFLEGIALNPAGLLFPTLSLGTTSEVQTVTLTNGDNTLTINSIKLTGAAAGDFAETNNCPSTVTPGAQCTISVTFTPTALGIRKASIEITDSALGSPQFISLTGSTSTVGITPASVAFGSQAVGVASAAQPVTLTNVGNSVLTISAVAPAAPSLRRMIAPLLRSSLRPIAWSTWPSLPSRRAPISAL